MKLSPNTAPGEPDDLLIRMHNQVGAAVDVIGTRAYQGSGWRCHGCGDHSDMLDGFLFTRRKANDHATACRASLHRLH
ncbi:hypothetical protein ACFWFZ_13310 [Streptomyces sp. NPDC060232]|uniref:hypothetical protein n=1 Tax=Streptomyces sp. NPDC060232 TaxID=3347079 RepID=UPI00364C674B